MVQRDYKFPVCMGWNDVLRGYYIHMVVFYTTAVYFEIAS